MRPGKEVSLRKQRKGKQWQGQQTGELQQNNGEVRENLSCMQASLIVIGQLNGIPVRCLLDTGSAISLVSTATYNRIPKSARPKVAPIREKFTGVNGGSLQVHGRTNSVMVFGHTQIHQELLVAETDVEVLLGMDFLQDHSCHLDLPRRILHLGDERLSCWNEDVDHAHFLVICQERITLQPQASGAVAGKIRRTGNITQWGVIEPCPKLIESSGLLFRQTLVSAHEDVVPVQVINCGNEPVTLHSNQLLGWCESVHWCEPPEQNRARTYWEINAIKKGVVKEDTIRKTTTERQVSVPAHLRDLFEHSAQHLDEKQRKQLAGMLHQYGDIFSAFKGDVGRTGLVKHKIDTGNARPIKQPPR